jgi:hypothetical protein
MGAPAVMVKLTEPSGDLYTIMSITDEEIRQANNRFISGDAPYRIRRTPGKKFAL